MPPPVSSVSVLVAVLCVFSQQACDAFAPYSTSAGVGGKQGAGGADTTPLLAPESLRAVSRTVQASTDRASALSFDATTDQVQAWAASAVGLSSSDQLELKSDTKEATQRHVRFQQVELFEGGKAKVYGGDAVVHIDTTDTVYAITGTVVPGTASVPLPPTVSRDSAIAAIVQHVQTERGVPTFTAAGVSTPELSIVPTAGGLKLVWCSESHLVSGGSPTLLRVCTDAHGSGVVLESRNVLRTAAAKGVANTLYCGTVPITTDKVGSKYYLRDPTRYNMYTIDMKNANDTMDKDGNILEWAPGTFDPALTVTDKDNKWGNFSNEDPATAAGDAHFGMQMSVDYYKNVHGRQGVDGKGLKIFSRVHSNWKYDNAFWDDSCNCMSYGDGNYFKTLVALDVAGHEITHGVTSHSADLVYEGESGGLNEAMSDIFGTMIEYYANNTLDTPDYYIGEELFPKTADNRPTSALRIMRQPSLDTKSYDCWNSTLKTIDVHYSSGPANHWYYLFAEGSTPKTAGLRPSPTCNGKAVLGIGRAKAEKVLYRALTVYMTAHTNYKDARYATLLAAKDLYGGTSATYLRCDKAWAAVNVRGPRP